MKTMDTRWREILIEIEQATASLNRLKGEKDSLLKELNNSFKIETVPEAEKLLKKLEKESNAIESIIQGIIMDVEEQLGGI